MSNTVNNDFTPNGHKIFYWPNGNKRMEGTWSDGRKTGTFTYYNEDGTINNTIEYTNDLANGECKRYLNNGVVMNYKYDSGSLLSSKEYVAGTLIGDYTYADALLSVDPDAPKPPEIGTLFHSYNGKHPSEIFQGTVWTYIENSYEIDDNGRKVPVDVWLREPDGGNGPYVYNGDFIEYRVSDGTKLRTGTYGRIFETGKKAVSVLDGKEYLYRANGSLMYKGEWNNGAKIGTVEFYDEKNRVWKGINLNNSSKYIDGYYNIMDIKLSGKISYTFDSNTQAAHLKLLK